MIAPPHTWTGKSACPIKTMAASEVTPSPISGGLEVADARPARWRALATARRAHTLLIFTIPGGPGTAMMPSRGSLMSIEHRVSVLAFDVYGTLIDPFRMEDHLRAIFGERAKEATELWRSKQLEYSFRRALMKKYENFDVCTAQALDFVSAQLGIPLAEEEKRRLLAEYLRLPAYPDAAGALKTLQQQGFQMVAFSNGTERSVRALL